MLFSLRRKTELTLKDAKKTLSRGSNMSVTSWFLVSSSGTRHRLPREMIFVGREDCELMLQSRSVDKQHAVINYDPNTDEHMVKDLGSLNGTFVNDLRIPDQTYITLKLSDVIRFGYDAHVYILEKSQHKVPEEALKHEKYTSQLQLSFKALEARAKAKQQQHSSEKSKDSVAAVKLLDRAERRAHSLTAVTDSPISKRTPLYGQPSWWGEDEAANTMHNRSGKETETDSTGLPKEVPRYEVNGSLSDSHAKALFSYRREPSYFEIPTKEFQPGPATEPESQVHEVPTKDTADAPPCVSSTPTPPVVQSHASFTIEFDSCAPGKMKIKDHVTKFCYKQQQQRKLPSTEAVTAPTEVMSAESKVADWLVQSNASMRRRRRSQSDESCSTKSDSSVQRLNKDAVSFDSVAPAVNGEDFPPAELQSEPHSSQPHHNPPSSTPPDPEEPSSSAPSQSLSRSSPSQTDPHHFVIEFFEENSRKISAQPDAAGPVAQLDKTRNTSSPSVERQVKPPASSSAATQRYTVPLKSAGSSSWLHRAGSLRREKTDDQISTSYSSRSSSSVSVRPFGSVGRRSKLAQEFTAEFLKQAKREKSTASPPAAAKTSLFDQNPVSPGPTSAPYQPKTSSPIHQPVPLKVPVMPVPSPSVDTKSSRDGPRNEEEDCLSDAGTYTIEADNLDKELEEARGRIDQVFGVVESPERSGQTSAEDRPVVIQGREQHRQTSWTGQGQSVGQSVVKAPPAAAVSQGPPKWMSRWASLADSYSDCGPSSGLCDISSQMEQSGGGGRTLLQTSFSPNHDGSGSEGSRARRLLPQVPPGEKSDTPAPGLQVPYDLHSTFDVEENSAAIPKAEDRLHWLRAQEDVEPDSLSDGSNSDDSSVVVQRRRPVSNTLQQKNEDEANKPSSFYIDSEETASKPENQDTKPASPNAERKHSPKSFSSATLTKHRHSQESLKVRPCVSAPILGPGAQSPEAREAALTSLVRQESFTTERPSNDRLPNISSQAQTDADMDQDFESFQGSCNQDTHSYLKETEDVLAVLEAKLQAARSQPAPSPLLDSLSGESDMDTSSTVSQHSNKTRPNTLMSHKASNNGLQRQKSSASLVSQSERLSEKSRPSVTDSRSKTDVVRRPVGLRRGEKKSDEPKRSSVSYSDQESGTHQTHRKYTVPLQKDDTKTAKGALVRANSMSAPRATRTSMLRRARLGDASDNEGTETDRLSQDAGNVPAKPAQENKKLSRLDILAMPRKRTSSFTTPSDTEASAPTASSGRTAGFSNRSTESSGSSVRRSSVSKPAPAPAPQKAALSKTPITRGRSSSAKYTSSRSSSRRRQKGSGYTSTSDEEYDSSQHTPKHKRSQPSSASHSRAQPRAQPMVALRPKSRSRDSEEEEGGHEGDAYHWSSHSAEIARLSQDLAKDLAILAREIHDVAGEGDPQSSTVGASAPAAATAQEEEVQHIPEAGPTYQRDASGSAAARTQEQNSAHSEPANFRQQAVNGEEQVIVDNLMLDPVSQIITAIRANTEELSGKIKTLFQDKMDVWEEIEAKVGADTDAPVIRTSNKEVTSILNELRRVQRQLEVINTVMEPSERPEASKASAPVVSSTRGVRSTKPPATRSLRPGPSVTHRAAALRPGDGVRRGAAAAAAADDGREAYLV
ncbi:centrosomal protein of 170 kDa protein B isoform X2 [Genypterus blacodes]|uniref:centrosomal protein of 170 kDa protein B isoform X2 n=1 Tax=Genypterus blacodes TaxID=154954 RepID=UPI003F75E14A